MANVDPVLVWLGLLIIMIVILGVIGKTTTQLWRGVLIDFANTMSLSRLQAVLWTVLILSAYLVVAIPRMFTPLTDFAKLPDSDSFKQQCVKDHPSVLGGAQTLTVELCGGGPLQISFPEEVVLAMGISLGSLAGSSLIKKSKAGQAKDTKPAQDQVNALRNLATPDQNVIELRQISYLAEQTRNAAKVSAGQEGQTPGYQQRQGTEHSDSASLAAMRQQLMSAFEQFIDAVAKSITVLQVKTGQPVIPTPTAPSAEMAEHATKQAEAAKAALAAQEKLDADKASAEGQVHTNAKPSDSRWSDIFRSNDAIHYENVDLGKVQMLFFTVVVLLAYGVAIGALLHDNAALKNPLGVDFPALAPSQLALLGFSQGAYLANKIAS